MTNPNAPSITTTSTKMQPLTTADLIFPSASKSLHTTINNIKKSNLSISNRLHSIHHDAIFVSQVLDTYQLPLIANERCGSWYIPPNKKVESVYFKSTDGHAGEWSLNLRRLNIHLLDVIGEKGGCIIVDSTRRGKSMPDALSKTLPIWICVLNRHLLPNRPEGHALKTPESVISRSEHAQIEERIASFVRTLHSLELNVEALGAKLKGKPLEPVWVTQDSEVSCDTLDRSDRNVLVLCTASGRTASTGSVLFDYVQGAADDSESWACGLSAVAFWQHSKLLLSTSEDDLPATIRGVMSEIASNQTEQAVTAIESTNVSIGSNVAAESTSSDFDLVISCSELPYTRLAEGMRGRYVHLAAGTGKIGSRRLRDQLPKLKAFAPAFAKKQKILVMCQTGRDLAVGVALAIVCLSVEQSGTELSKPLIKQQLSRIMLSMPKATPSGATLQSVNAFLLDQRPKHRTP